MSPQQASRKNGSELSVKNQELRIAGTYLPPVPFCQVILRAQKPQLETNNRFPNNLSTLGNHIRKRLLELKLTAKEVGKRLSVDIYTVYDWEYNFSSTNPRRLSKIIEFLGYEPNIPVRRFCGEKLLAYRKLHGISQAKLA